MRRSLLALLLLLAASAPSGGERKVHPTFDPAFDFTPLATFDLRIPAATSQGALASALLPRLESVVVEVLGAKGYRRDRARPDFVVTFTGQIAETFIQNKDVHVDLSDRVVWEMPDGGGGASARGLLAVRMSLPDQAEPFWWVADSTRLDGKVTTAKVWKKAEPLARRLLGAFPAK